MSSEYDLYMKAGDTNPPYSASLQDDSGNAIDLSNITQAKIHVRKKDTGELVVDKTMTVTNASAGELEYAWNTGDLSEKGVYEIEVEVEYSDGSKETFPNTDHHQLKVNEQIS